MATVTYSSDTSGVSGFCVATWTGDGAAQELLPGFKPRMILLANITDNINDLYIEGMTSTLGTQNTAANGTVSTLTSANGITVPATASTTANGQNGARLAAGINVNAKVYVAVMYR